MLVYKASIRKFRGGRAKANHRCDQGNETLHTPAVFCARNFRSGCFIERVACGKSFPSKIEYLEYCCAEIIVGIERNRHIETADGVMISK